MLFIALIAAILLYAALGYAWQLAQPGLNSSTPALETLRGHILGMPQDTVLLILKWGIIILGIYLVADALIASSSSLKRRKTRRRDSALQDEELRASGYPGDDASSSR